MTEKEFARMTEEELRVYCEEQEKELSIARWYLRNKTRERIERQEPK